MAAKTSDYGVAQYFPSHEPWLVPEPMPIEPSESFSKSDVDTYAAILADVARQARKDPDAVRAGPTRSRVHRLDPGAPDDPDVLGAHVADPRAQGAPGQRRRRRRPPRLRER